MTQPTTASARAGGGEIVHRQAGITPGSYDKETRSVEAVFSKGTPVRRWSYVEVLEISVEAIDLGRVEKGLVTLLDTHNRWQLDAVLGSISDVRVEGDALVGKITFADTEEGRKIEGMVARGELKGISIGYAIRTFETTKAEGEKPEIRKATKWELMEVSLVPVPADPEAGIRSEQAIETRTEGPDTDAGGASPIERNDMSTPKNGGGAPAPTTTREQPNGGTPTRAATPNGGAPENAQREQTVTTRTFDDFSATDALAFVDMARGFGDDVATRANELVQKVAKDEMGPDGARSALLKSIAEAQSGEAEKDGIRGGSGIQMGDDAHDKFIRGATNALVQRSGLAQNVRTAAKKRGDEAPDLDPGEFRGIRMVDLARMALEIEGERVQGHNRDAIVAQAMASTAFQRSSVLQSSSTFAVILENTMHKSLQSAYAIVPDSWRRFVGVASVSDFRPHNHLLMGTFGKLDRLTETGEFKRKHIPDAAKEVRQAFEHGNIIAISRQAIVNDDLGAFVSLAQEFGRAAGLSIEIDAYALLKQNSGLGPNLRDGNPLFHADHNNIGATAGPPSTATFDEQRVLMASHKDPSDNEVLDIRPSVWVGPIGLGGEARVINDAVYDPDTPNKLQKPNKVRGQYSDIVDTARLTGNRWYSFADPSFNPAIVASFLDGVQEPQLEMKEAWNTSGSEYRVRFDYGLDAINHRSAGTNAGA